MFNFSFKDRNNIVGSGSNKTEKKIVVEKPSNIKVFTSSKFINKVKDNYHIKEELEQISDEINDNLSKNRNVPLTNIKIRLNNIIKEYPDEGFAYFLFGKILNFFKDYYNAYKYINNAIDKGYSDCEELRKELLEKIIKFKNVDSYYLEQELYKTIQLLSKEQAIYKVSFKKEDIQKIESFYDRVKSFCDDLSDYEQKDKFLKPCKVLLDKIIGILENSVLLNIFYEAIQSRMNYFNVLNKYTDIDKEKIYFVIVSQLIIFENIFSNMNISRNSDLGAKFYELSNIINANYSYEEDFLDDFFNYDEYNDFEEERETKILTLHKVKISVKDNSKLIGLLLKSIDLYDNISQDNISDIVDYIDELEYVISYLKKNMEISITFILKLELVISSYLSWFLLLYEIRNDINYFGNQILERNIKKLKLCL